MAITINKQPDGHTPLYNDMIYIVQSDKTAQPNFKYVMDVYINGAAVKSFRETVPVHPTLGVGVFNPYRTIENYFSRNFDLSLTGVTQCPDSIGTIQCNFGEEYGLSSSGTTVYPNQAADSFATWNGIFDFENWCDYDEEYYRSGNSPKSAFLTNSPANKVVLTHEKEYLYAINRLSGDIYYFQVDTADSIPNSIGRYRIYNSYQAQATYADRMVRCPAGWNLNDIPSSDIIVDAGTLPIMTNSVAYYTIKCVRFDGTETIIEKTFTNDTNCDRFTKYRMHFLNKLGGYDSFTFTKKNKFVSDIKRENYKKNLGELTSTTAYNFDKSQRAITQYSTSIEDKITVKSDYLTSGDVVWLEELVTSPDVYVERNGAAIPIIITDSSFERHNGEDKKLFNLSVEFKYSYKRHRQRF